MLVSRKNLIEDSKKVTGNKKISCRTQRIANLAEIAMNRANTDTCIVEIYYTADFHFLNRNHTERLADYNLCSIAENIGCDTRGKSKSKTYVYCFVK